MGYLWTKSINKNSIITEDLLTELQTAVGEAEGKICNTDYSTVYTGYCSSDKSDKSSYGCNSQHSTYYSTVNNSINSSNLSTNRSSNLSTNRSSDLSTDKGHDGGDK